MGMDSFWRRRVILLSLAAALPLSLFAASAIAQGLQTSPYGAPSILRGLSSGGLDLAPSNPLGLPGSSGPGAVGSGSLYVSEGMLRGILPLIPNLQFGYLYDFGNSIVSSGRFTADYLAPLRLSGSSVIFGEAHTEFQSFWKTPGINNRVDVSLGGGFRRLLKGHTLLGVSGFYDASRLGGTWYSSGGVGLEMAALVSGNDAIDLNFNWYGQLFNGNVIRNAFRYGPSNYDFQAGYSHELWNGGPDLRLKMTGYQFNIGQGVYGWNAGAELKSRDGVFVLKYDVGHDKVNRTYQTVGGFVNVGLQLENLLRGESPFTMPEPIFKSPRNLTYMLTQKVNRNWHQPSQVVVSNGGEAHFQLTIFPPYWCDGADCSSGVVETQSTSGAIWRITFTHQSGDDWCGASGGYMISLVGDTSRVVFPLTVTITPSDWAAWIDQFTVRQDYLDFLPETTIMANSSDLAKNIPPDGSGVVVAGEHPRIHRNLFTGAEVGFQGRFTISAPGVTPLVVDIISAN